MTAILRIRDPKTGKMIDIPAIKGAKGEDGKDGTNGFDGAAGSDGQDGQDGKGIEFIFIRQNSATPPPKPNGVNTDDNVPSGWTDDQQGVTSSYQYEFVCKRVKSGGSWGVYSSPALWAKFSFDGDPGLDGKDGTDYEFIFTRTASETKPSAPATSQTDDYIPSGWTDNADGVTSTHQYEWTSKRTKTNGIWGDFSTPALWSKYSFDGAAGQPGADGSKGLPGEKGADGKQMYTWIRYSDHADGTNMDNNPDRTYIGIAVNQYIQLEGNDKSVYKWSKTKGADGVPGEKGKDGKQLYTWVMYADTSNGGGISNDATGKSHIGFAYNKDTATESSNPSEYKWSLTRGSDGQDFDDAAYQYLKETLKNGKTDTNPQGINGVVLSNILGVVPPKEGDYLMSDLRAGISGILEDKVAFFANPVDAYNIAKDFFNGTGVVRPKFGVNDEGKAVADDIDIGGGMIGNWTIENGKLSSQESTTDGTPRALLDGDNGEFTIASDVYRYSELGTNIRKEQTIKISSLTGEIKAITTDNDAAIISSQGIFANRAGVQAIPSSSGITFKASIVGLGLGNLQKEAFGNENCICGIYGSSTNNAYNPAPDYGGWFNKLRANGMFFNARATSGNTVLMPSDVILFHNAGVNATYTLPSNAYAGQFYIIIANQNTIFLNTNGYVCQFFEFGNNTVAYPSYPVSILLYVGYNTWVSKGISK